MSQDDGIPLLLEFLQLLGKIDTKIYTGSDHRLVSSKPMDSQPNDRRYLFGFLGAGKLAGSVIRGLLRAKFCSASDIIAGEPNEQARAALSRELGISVTPENSDVAGQAQTLFVGVKPAVVLPVLRGVDDERASDRVVISLAAGVRCAAMEAVTSARIMRAMTNTPSAICRAATAVARGSRTLEKDMDLAKQLFGSIGAVVEVPEEEIDAVTALSGSGPAFVYSVIEALAEGGVSVGLSPEVALTLATQTVLGAAQLAAETKLAPEELRRMVVTPGGTTAAGLAAMEKQGVSQGLVAAVEAATKRGQEMAGENA
jgi:pyrroline-5-carboxylate reductase